MRGFTLQVGKERISGAVEAGISGCLITYEEGAFKIYFGGMDGNDVFPCWYDADLKDGDNLSIYYENVLEMSKPKQIRDVKNHSAENKLLLESYYKMKQELIDEELIESQYDLY